MASLAGSSTDVDTLLYTFLNDPTLGMIYPDPPANIRPAMAWTRNKKIAEWVVDRLGAKSLPCSHSLEFPAGSMFWARTEAIKPLLDLSLSPNDFPPEEGQEDGTLAHALERMLGVVVNAGGYKMARLKRR